MGRYLLVWPFPLGLASIRNDFDAGPCAHTRPAAPLRCAWRIACRLPPPPADVPINFNTICKYAMGKTIGMGIAGRAACGRVRGAGMLT